MKDHDGTSKGSAFIRFRNKEDALLAIRFLNGSVYLNGSDKPLEVRFAENKKKISAHTAQNPPSTLSFSDTPAHPLNPISVRNFLCKEISSLKKNFAFYKDIAPDGHPYYWNPYTMQTQWEEPSAGSYVIPKALEAPYYVKSVVSSTMPRKQGPQGGNLFIFHLPSDWSKKFHVGVGV